MRTIKVERRLNAPIDRLFDVLADHPGYATFPGVKSAELIRPGVSETNGAGALRKIDVGAAWFEEEITGFHRPSLLEYKILRSSLPFRHDIGRITFVQEAGAVRVTWTSTFRLELPVIGRIATALAAWQLSRGFAATLEHAARRACEPAVMSHATSRAHPL